MQCSKTIPSKLLPSVTSFRCKSVIATSEPSNPSIKTNIPGPKSLELKKEMAKVHVSFLIRFKL